MAESQLPSLHPPDGISDPEVEAYKAALKCRLEVQYVIALLRLQYSSEASHPKVSRADAGAYWRRVNDALASGTSLLGSGEPLKAMDALLTADALLGKVIGLMRRRKGHTCDA